MRVSPGISGWHRACGVQQEQRQGHQGHQGQLLGQYGPAKCGSLLGAGVQKDSFTVPTSGDTVAKYVMYFNTGTIHGTYDLTPQSSSLNFLATSWTGTLKVLGGTGAYKGVTGTGKMKCGSPDGVHTSCTDKLKLKKLTAG
jgi:hypothetical protein